MSESIENVPTPWFGKIWARTGCTFDPSTLHFSCGTGDCDTGSIICDGANKNDRTPATLVEFTLAPSSDGVDIYDISLVEGFNLPVSITPIGRTGECVSPTCSSDINSLCPSDLSVKGRNGNVIGCKSSCLAFGRDEDCCTGAFGSPFVCKPVSTSAKIFEQQCPQAFSYAYDDENSVFICRNTLGYEVTFCP